MCTSQLIIVLPYLLSLASANEGRSRLVQLDDCTCLGYTQTFECSILGGGITIWNGSAFDCLLDEIYLRHSQFINTQITGKCNNGTVVATSIGVSEDGYYTSQLNITIIPEIVNESILCTHRDISSETTMIIGQSILVITMDQFPPPSGVHLESVDSNQLVFTWNKVTARCPSIRYITTTKNCGICPKSTSNTSITCSTFQDTRGKCMFAVHTEVCRSVVGERSEYVVVNLYVPSPPRFKLRCGNDNLTQSVAVDIAFNTTIMNTAISDDIDGSPISYTIIYSDFNSGSICGLSSISTNSSFSCQNGEYCQIESHNIDVSSPCSSSGDLISVSVFATNVIGSSPFSQPVIFTFKTTESNHCRVIYHIPDSTGSTTICKQRSSVTTYILSALLAIAFTLSTLLTGKLLKDSGYMKRLLQRMACRQNSVDSEDTSRRENNVSRASNNFDINIRLNENAAYSAVRINMQA